MSAMEATTSTTDDKPYQLQTLMRGAAVLDLLIDRDFLTLKETSTALGLNTSVTYRLLRTWTQAGYLNYDSDGKRYFPGLNLVRLAGKSHRSSGLLDVEERLRTVSNQVQQTASFSVLAGRHALYAARIVANKSLMYQVEIGKTLPAYATSAGHVLLAWLPEEELLELFPEPVLLGYTDSTLRSRDELFASLAKVRENGYAFNHGQLSESVAAVAVPVRDAEGNLVGAFSIAGPAAEFSNDDIYRRYLPALLEAARQPVSIPKSV